MGIRDIERHALLEIGPSWDRSGASSDCGDWPLPRFSARPAISLVGQEMLDGSQQVGAEATSGPIEAAQAVPFEQLGEERVRQVAGVVVAGSVAPHEHFHGAVVRIAQVAQRLSGFRRLAPGGENVVQRVVRKEFAGRSFMGNIHSLIPESERRPAPRAVGGRAGGVGAGTMRRGGICIGG